MLSTKSSSCAGASLLLHSDIALPSAGTSLGVLARDAVAAGPVAAAPVPAVLAEQIMTRIADRDLLDVIVDKTGCRQVRDRALPAWIAIYVVLALCLFASEGYASVLRHVWPGLNRLRGRQVRIPHASAVPKARQRVGIAPFAALFDQVRGPIATPDTIGTYRFGLRIVALDGTTLDVPDSADNDAAFDRSNDATKTPQVRVSLLIECGTHAILAARFDGIQTSEHVMADDLITDLNTDLRPGILLLADRNYYSFTRWHDAAATGAHLLWRVRTTPGSGTVRVPIHTRLSDGSYLSTLREPDSARRVRSRRSGVGTGLPRRRPDITVRVIDYTITITTSDGTIRHERYRLLCTILDPTHASAAELAACYHERWESETGYGHLKTRLRGPRAVLRSQHPDGVRQEIWAYLCVYQALCHLAVTAADHAGLDPDRISFTVTLREFRRSVISPTDHPPHQILDRIITQALPNRRNRISDRRSKTSGRKRRSWTATYKITIQPHPPP